MPMQEFWDVQPANIATTLRVIRTLLQKFVVSKGT
jgi:hypothetical protein